VTTTSPPPPGGELAAQLATLAVDQTTVRRRLETLADQVATHAKAVDRVPELAATLRALAKEAKALKEPTAPTEPPLWDWSAMPRKQAEKAWDTLTSWVREVLIGVYRLVDTSEQWTHTDHDALAGLGLTDPDRGKGRLLVPRCWYHHPDVVAELGWLAQNWLETYRSAEGRTIRAADWHDRYLPGVLRRINDTSTAAECTMRGHKGAPPPDKLDNAALSDAIRADLDQRH